MKKRCFLLVCKDTLFKQAMLSLLTGLTEVEIIESKAHDIDSLLHEVSLFNPSMILLEESSPLSIESRLIHVLVANPGRPVIVVSQENNLMHVVYWETVQISSAHDLIDTIRLA